MGFKVIRRKQKEQSTSKKTPKRGPSQGPNTE